MKLFAIPPVIYELFGIKNVAGTQINPATEEKQDLIIANQETNVLLRAIFSMLQLPRNHDMANNSDRVTVVNTVTTTVSSITQFNGVQSHQMSVASELSAWYNCCRSTIT